MSLEGVISRDGSVLGDDNKRYFFPVRGTDKEGFSEVLVNAYDVGGEGWMFRQSIKPYIGMRVEFECSSTGQGYNYKILKKQKEVK